MAAIDLFLLGFFMNNQKPLTEEQSLPTFWGAYDLAKFIENNDLQEMIKVSTPAVYKNIAALSQKGYLTVEIVKENSMPEKKVYKITDKGKEYFIRLLEITIHNDIKYNFDFNTVVLNLDKVDQKTALMFLKELQQNFLKKRDFLNNCIQRYSFIPLPGLTLIKQNQMINETLIQWINELRDEYQKEDF